MPSISHANLASVYGTDSTVLKAAQQADKYDAHLPPLGRAPYASDSGYVLRDRYLRSLRGNSQFDSLEAAIGSDPLFDGNLRPGLQVLDKLTGAPQKGAYTRVDVKLNLKSMLRQTIERDSRAASLAPATFAGTGLEAAVAKMLEFQQNPTDQLTSQTVATLQSSSLFDSQFPGAAAKIAARFVTRTEEVVGGPADVTVPLYDKGGIKVEAQVHTEVKPLHVNVGPKLWQWADYVLTVPPRAIVTIDTNGEDRACDGHWYSGNIKVLRADDAGHVTIPGDVRDSWDHYVRILNPDTHEVIARLAIPRTSPTIMPMG